MSLFRLVCLIDGQNFGHNDEGDDDEVHHPKDRERNVGKTSSDVAGLKVFRQVLSDRKEILHTVVHEEHRP